MKKKVSLKVQNDSCCLRHWGVWISIIIRIDSLSFLSSSVRLSSPLICPLGPPSPSSSSSFSGHRHVAFWGSVPVSLHVHGGSRGGFFGGFVVGAPASLPERSASPPQVQPLLPPHDGPGQHAAHHRHAPRHGRRRDGAEGRRPGPGQPRVGRHPGLHVGGDQPLVHHLLGLRLHVPQNVHGERRCERAAEHPAAGQRTGIKPGQVPERLPLGLFLFLSLFFKHTTCFSFQCCDERVDGDKDSRKTPLDSDRFLTEKRKKK